MDDIDKAIVGLATARDRIVEAAAVGAELPDAALVDALGAVIDMRLFLDEFSASVEGILRTRMRANDATLVPHPVFEVTLRQETIYDRRRLTPLKELVPEEVLEQGFTPAHDEVKHVGDQWDMRVVNRWKAYGGEIAEIVASAAVPGPPEITLKRKS